MRHIRNAAKMDLSLLSLLCHKKKNDTRSFFICKKMKYRQMNLYVSARLIMYVFLVFEKRTRFYAPNFRISVPHRCRITVSSKTKPSANFFSSGWFEPRINKAKSVKLQLFFFFSKLGNWFSSCSRFRRGCLSFITE